MTLAAGLAAIATGAALRAHYEPRLEQLAGEAASLRADLADQIRTVGTLRQQLDERERALNLAKSESADLSATIALLGDPATRVVALAGLKPRPEARARMIWNPRTGGLLLAADLPPPSEGETYELWAIAAGNPIPAGLFTVEHAGRGSLGRAAGGR